MGTGCLLYPCSRPGTGISLPSETPSVLDNSTGPKKNKALVVPAPGRLKHNYTLGTETNRRGREFSQQTVFLHSFSEFMEQRKQHKVPNMPNLVIINCTVNQTAEAIYKPIKQKLGFTPFFFLKVVFADEYMSLNTSSHFHDVWMGLCHDIRI